MLTMLLLAGAVSIGHSAKAAPQHCNLGQSTSCWVPRVTYREMVVGILDGETPAYVARVAQLLDGEHDFEQREDAKAYVDVLMVRGFWIDHMQMCDGDGVKCLLIPPSAIESVQLVQIVHPPH